MLVIALVSQKGGAGKSTLAANLTAYAASNSKTAIIDLDPQASISSWHSLRESDHITLLTSHPPLLSKQIDKLAADGYDLCVIDTPPHNSTAAATAIKEADLTVIPVRPSGFDLVAVQATFNLLGENLGAVIVNAIPSGTAVQEPAIEFVKESGVRLLGTVGQRIAFQHASNSGLGVTEYEASGKAASEIKKIWKAIESIL